MSLVERLTKDVTFDPGFDPGSLRFDEELSFLKVDPRQVGRLGVHRFVGFSTPISRDGGFTFDKEVHPITEYADLPPDHSSADEQGKGVGTRLYKTLESFGGAKEPPEKVGLYAVDIPIGGILDLTQKQGNKAMQVARHASRLLRAQILGTEKVIDGIHASYGDAAAVRLKVPALPQARRHLHGVEDVPDLVPEFLIIRDPSLVLTRIGLASSPW